MTPPGTRILIHENERLVKHLAKYGYFPTRRTDGFWCHITRPLQLCLVVNDFGVKLVVCQHAEHLMNALTYLYQITSDWSGTKHCGLTID
jgi:hypothetical protein